MGAVVTPTRRTALVVWRNGRTQQLDAGDTIAGWTIEKIGVTSLTLTRDTAIRTLNLFPAAGASVPSAIEKNAQ
jgi:hypothetical protein